MTWPGAGTRDWTPGTPTLSGPVGKRWAVIVGVSQYRDSALNLEFADRDAVALRDLVATPAGGNFETPHTRLLTNEEATTAAVTQALRGFLMQAVPDDLVLLFFACHGGTDPRRPGGPLYLFTHDTDPSDIAGTAFAMDEIDRSLRQLIQAQRVVIIADTCHSGGIGSGPSTRSAVTAEATNQYLQAMASSKPGVALLTSAEASEASLEDARWGGGHGVFTHYLLEGMRGAADGFGGDKDGIVSIGELFEYVREQVQRATDGRQHPAIGTTQFDRGLPMAVTGDLDVEQHLSLGRRLVDVGWCLDDPAPMLLAAHQFGLAADLKRRLPQADAERGAALLAAEQHAQAAQALRTAIAAGEGLPASVWLHLGVAEASRGEFARAAEALRNFGRLAPGDPLEAWATSYADWLERPAGRLRALVIGVGSFPPGSRVTPLPGVGNDIRALTELMSTTFAVQPEHLTVCVDEQASAVDVRDALHRLGESAEPDDVAIVYFGGHSVPTAQLDEPYLVTFDDQEEGTVGVTARELVDALGAVTGHVVLILDTHVSPALVGLVSRQAHLTVLLACSVGEVAYEMTLDGLQRGLFTAALEAQLRDSGRNITYRALVDAVHSRMAVLMPGMAQTPQLATPHDGRVLAGRFATAGLWWAVHRTIPRPADVSCLETAAREQGVATAAWALARHALAEGSPIEAADLLATAAGGLTEHAVHLDLARAEIAMRRAPEAIAALHTAELAAKGSTAEVLEAAVAAVERSTRHVPEVVVVAPLSGYVTEQLDERAGQLQAASAASSRETSREIRDSGGNPDMLGPIEATVEAFRSAVTRLAALQDRPAVIVYAGGFQATDGHGAYRYRLADGWLSAADLARVTTGATHLVALLELTELKDIVDRDIIFRQLAPSDLGFDVAVVSRDQATTDRLLSALSATNDSDLTYGEWLAAAADGTALSAELVPSSSGDWRVLDSAGWRVAREAVERAIRLPAEEAARLAGVAVDRRLARHEEHPEGHLQRGLARLAARDLAGASADLRTARNLYDDASVAQAERLRDPQADRWHFESRYHHGRLQYQQGEDLFDAVASLRAASRQRPDDPRAELHLVYALRALIEQETLVEARLHARQYLALGAPLGDAEGMAHFVGESQPP